MSNIVILVGATGDLGGRIARELKAENATVRYLVRPDTSAAKRQSPTQFASEVVDVNFADVSSISNACAGGGVVVSAVAGLLARRLGMRVEGELRENRWFRGRWWNTTLLSILESEWR